MLRHFRYQTGGPSSAAVNQIPGPAPLAISTSLTVILPVLVVTPYPASLLPFNFAHFLPVCQHADDEVGRLTTVKSDDSIVTYTYPLSRLSRTADHEIS